MNTRSLAPLIVCCACTAICTTVVGAQKARPAPEASEPAEQAEPAGDAAAGEQPAPEQATNDDFDPDELLAADLAAQKPPSEPEPEPVAEEVHSVALIVRPDPRSNANDWMIAPADSVRLGLETALVTADGDLTPVLATRQLALTDLVLLRLAGAYSVGGKMELLAGLTLLPKQPIQTEASAFQGAGLGARVGLASSWALTLSGQAGPTIDRDGAFVDGALTLDGRYRADRYIVFEGNVGVGATAISPSDKLVGFTEAVAATDVILQEPRKAAVSVGVQFAFPFWTGDTASTPLDPQTRVDVHLTGVLALADEWDVWLRGAVIDRGDLSVPASLLPILDGGFDQQQLTLGISYRSDTREPDFGL